MPTPGARAEYAKARNKHEAEMHRYMKEVADHADAFAELEQSPAEAVKHIDDLMKMLREASYNAERMRVLDNLMRGAGVPRSGVDIQ